MTFGQRIKSLRREANMTQEQLAELLSISPQAVSRWETDVAMPDISLLPPLANLFGVTTDYLLGMETYQKDLRKSEYDEAFHDYWKRYDKEENYQIAIRAVAEYPGNMEYVEWLASSEYYIAIPQTDDAEYTRLLESSVKHYKIVIENCNDYILLNKALHGIVFSLTSLGRKDEAKEYAIMEKDEEKREEMLFECLDGDEKTKLCQKIADRCVGKLILYLKLASKSVETYEAIEQIMEILFPDGNYQYYHNILQYNLIEKASILCREGKYDCAIETLQKSRYHAVAMVECDKHPEYRFTSPFFSLLCFEKKESETSPPTDVDDFISCLNNYRSFDPIRDRDDFKALLAP